MDPRACPRGSGKALGLTLLVIVVVIWVAAAFVIQAAQEAGVHVVVLTFIANALFTLYLPVYVINVKLKGRSASEREADKVLLLKGAAALEGQESAGVGQAIALPAISRGVLKAALVIGPLWYFAQLVFNLSLTHTSVTSSLLLSSTSSLFTFLFSVVLLFERFTLRKLGCILLLIAGTAVYTLGDAEQASGGAAAETLFGDFLVLASAVLYASYTIAIRLLLGDDDEAPMTLFFGLSGLTVLLGLGPPLLVLWLAGVNLGSITWTSFGLVVAMGLIDNVCSDYLFARAILLAGPTVASAGLSLQVPLAMVSDAIFHTPVWLGKASMAAFTLSGAALILVGFLGINLVDRDSSSSSSSDGDKDGQVQPEDSDLQLEMAAVV